jgi:prepilin-type N-terminal cleavage/methylation domain-containing protein
MDKNSIFKPSKFTKGFTLIELLVVVAIIGILSSVVITSLNSAREKSKVSSIKSTLKQLYNQAAINQVTKGNFAGSNVSHSDLTCTGLKEDGTQGDATTGNLAKIAQHLIDQGIIVKCFSYNGSSYGDVYLRFGATALMYDTNELKAWSVDENGIVKWDDFDLTSVNPPGGDSKTQLNAKTACATNGGRLPSLEIFYTLIQSWRIGNGGSSSQPVGFSSGSYWTSTATPLYILQGYRQLTSLTGYFGQGPVSDERMTHCVR